ncbi:hypothetical protein ACLOJK_022041 [Asimina triloba]
MSRHVGAKIQENIMLVRCPGLNCKGVIEPEHCRHLVPSQVFERWEKALLESTIDVSQRIYCPFQDCSALLIDDGGDVERESECPNCHRLFCARCKVPWHSGVECEEYLRLGLGENERGKYDLMVLELAKKNMWRRCPTCNFYVEKIDGCVDFSFATGVEGRGLVVIASCILCRTTPWNPDENLDALVTMEQVRQAVEKLMDVGEEGEERRKSVRFFRVKARRAMAEGGAHKAVNTIVFGSGREQLPEKAVKRGGD